MAEHPEVEQDPARALRDAQEHLAATQEVLEALGRSGDDPSAVLDVVVERAASLCEAQAAQLYLIDGDDLRLSRVSGRHAPQLRDYLLQHPLALDRTSLSGRVALDRRTQQIPDVLADPEYGRRDLQQLFGFRTTLAAPLLFDDDVVGTLTLWRAEVDPFDDRAIALLESFATQATIVLRQVELTRALAARGRELAAKIDQLEALSEVGRRGQLQPRPRRGPAAHRRAAPSASPAPTAGRSWSTTPRRTPSTCGPRTAAATRCSSGCAASPSGATPPWSAGPRPSTARCAVTDLAEVPRDPHLEELYRDGWRSVLAVPMLRQGQLVGALVVRRRVTGAFPEDVGTLLQSLANQSALAIVNARMFRELSTSRRDLEVASRHKSEFLASMSHELRTPLNAVIGFSDVLLGGMFGALNARQEEYLGDILSSGRHLLELLNEILDLSKIEAGQMRLEPTVFSVPAALEYAAVGGARAGRPHGHRPRPGRGRRRGPGRVRRAPLQAGGRQPRRQRREVHPRRRHGRGSGPTGGRRARRVRVRHRHRHRARGPGADLRVLPAGRPGRGQGGGHRPGADAVPPHRRALRRPDHRWSPRSGAAVGSRSGSRSPPYRPVDDGPAADRAGRRRSCWSTTTGPRSS